MKFRKKPVIIEARQWLNNVDAMYGFLEIGEGAWDKPVAFVENNKLFIKTLEGIHEAKMYDWIIKGVKGEFYPCKPDIFEMTYEKVTQPTQEEERT